MLEITAEIKETKLLHMFALIGLHSDLGRPTIAGITPSHFCYTWTTEALQA